MGAVPHESWGVPVGASQTVPQCEILPVVVVEEEVVVSVVSRAIDDSRQTAGNAVVAVVDRDGPDVDENIQHQIEYLVEREKEGVDVVRESLQEAIYWMKGMTGKGCGDLPYVVWFVKRLLGTREQRDFILTNTSTPTIRNEFNRINTVVFTL